MNPLIQIIRQLSRPMAPLPSGIPPRLNPVGPVDTVLFDIYGTLLISGSGDIGTAAAMNSVEAMTRALIVAGYDGDCEQAAECGTTLFTAEIEERHHAARQCGNEFPEVDIRDVWRALIRRFEMLELIRPEPDEQKLLRLAVEYECRVNPVWPMPGAAEVLCDLKSRGLRLGIVSNAQFYTPLTLQALFGASPEELGFDPALCVWSWEALRAKPSVDLFSSLAAHTSLSRTLYVGNDMLNDIWTSSLAGCRTVLFAGDRRSLRLRADDPRCRNLQPEAVLNDLRTLPGVIGP